MGVVVQRHAPAALYPRERPRTHGIGGWVDPQSRSGKVMKISLPPEFEPWTVKPVAGSPE